MFNPYVILGVIIFWAASVGGAYYKGSQHAQEKARAEYAGQLEATITVHNKQAELDTDQAIIIAAKDTEARTRAAILRGQANDITRATPMPVSCNLDTERLKLLTAAVTEANSDSAPATSRVRDAINKANSPGK